MNQASKRRRESATTDDEGVTPGVQFDETSERDNVPAAPGTVEITAEIPVPIDEEMPQDIYRICHPGNRLFEALNIGYLTDVTIIVGDEAIKCHSNIVSIASPKLAALLKEKEPRLPDVDPRHFRLLLQIIYTGITNLLRDVPSVLDMGRVAHELQVHAAVTFCADYLAVTVDAENLWTILDFAYLINDAKLEESCFKEFCKKADILLPTEGFLKCKLATLEEILRQDKLCNVTELRLFRACAAWADTNSADETSPRAALGSALRLIRFRTFSAEDFAEYVSPTGLLSIENERDILRSCATGKNLMPEGFSESTIPRGRGSIIAMKFSSSGERKALNEFPRNVHKTFTFCCNKVTFILGVKLRAWRPDLIDGSYYEESVIVSLHDKITGRILVLQETVFCGHVKNGDMFSVKFKHPMRMVAYVDYSLVVDYSVGCTGNVTYELYGPDRCGNDLGLQIRNFNESVAPPDLHVIVTDKITT